MWIARSSMSFWTFSSSIVSKYSSGWRTSYGYRSVTPTMPLSRASSAIMCSRDVKTTFPSATIPSLRMASRITANACCPTSPSGMDEVWVAQVEFVDLRLRDELINLNDPLAFNGDAFEFLRFKLDILALGDLVTFDDVGTLHIAPGYGINFPVADAVAGLFIELVEANLFPLGRSWKQRDGT